VSQVVIDAHHDVFLTQKRCMGAHSILSTHQILSQLLRVNLVVVREERANDGSNSRWYFISLAINKE